MMPHNPLGPDLHGGDGALLRRRRQFLLARDARLAGRTSRLRQCRFLPGAAAARECALPVSDAPGLGVEVNEELVKKQSFKFWEAPHLKRRDGSVTNW